MEIVIRARNVGWNEELQQFVERSIGFATDRHAGRIEKISVSLDDLNGPRGGVDKHCQITATLQGGRPVLIEETGEDLASVVTRAAGRLGYRIGRSLQRRHTPGTRESRLTIRAA